MKQIFRQCALLNSAIEQRCTVPTHFSQHSKHAVKSSHTHVGAVYLHLDILVFKVCDVPDRFHTSRMLQYIFCDISMAKHLVMLERYASCCWQ